MTDRLSLPILLGFLCAAGATMLVRHLAVSRALLDHPNARSSHCAPVPRLGGVAIGLGTLAGVVLVDGTFESQVAALLGTALVLFAMGLIDDLRPLGAARKCGVQLMMAIVLVAVVRPDVEMDLPGWSGRLPGALAALFGVVWLCGLANAVNFMDGIDGIVAGLATVTAVGLVPFVQADALPLLVALAAASAGFLTWNSHPASIFMGDSGSQFIGFALAGMFLLPMDGTVELIPGMLLFAPFLFDTAFTLLRRLRSGENPFTPHRGHLYQRLTTAGWSHRTVAILYAMGAALGGIAAEAYTRRARPTQALILLAVAAVLVGFAIWTGREEGDLRGERRRNIKPRAEVEAA
ncbi:MAG: glycosyltransferase family 4 protein [Chloroflexota bacterium]|nr:glycosyltransferase family 4 protein [Chloroflexota bacterium]